MRKLFFLSNGVSYALAITTLYILMNFELGYKLLASIVASVVFFNYRRANIPYRDTLKNNGEIYLSPVHGTIESIRKFMRDDKGKEVHEIRISMSIVDEKGLYLPTSGEVTYLKANVGEKISRNLENRYFDIPVSELSHTDFVLTSRNQTKTLMRFIDCTYSKRPKIWLKSGDRGRGAACFGYYPFGGTLIIYLPTNSDILVFEKETIVPGLTVIAAIKEEK